MSMCLYMCVYMLCMHVCMVVCMYVLCVCTEERGSKPSSEVQSPHTLKEKALRY